MLTDHRAYATIPAADMRRAKAWYRDKLGLTPTLEDDMGCLYRVGGGTSFMLYPTMQARHPIRYCHSRRTTWKPKCRTCGAMA